MKDLTEGNIYKTFILFAFPLVLAGMLSQGYNLIDTVIAGKLLGDSGLAAIGASSAFLAFTSALFWGYATGSSVYLATLFGAQKYKEIKATVYHNIGTVAVTALFMALLVIIFCDPILRWLNVDESIHADAKIYLCIYISGAFLILLNEVFIQIMNAFGLSAFPFYMSVLSAVLNISGNILSVAILGLGVEGIAISSVLAALVTDMLYFRKLRQCLREMNVLKEKVIFRPSIILQTLRFAFPSACQQLVMYLAAFLISPIVNRVGSAATAAYAVIMQIYNIIAVIYQSSSRSLSNYAAQCIGAGKTVLLKKGVFVGFLQGLVFISIPLSVCLIFAESICAMFFPAGYTGSGMEYALLFVHVYLPLILFNLINNLFHSFYRGTASMGLLFGLTAFASATHVIGSLLLSRPFGIEGVYMGWALSWILEAIVALLTYFLGIWRKNSITAAL